MLLKFQLQQRKRNHFFETLSLVYCSKVSSGGSRVMSKNYFHSRIANNLFYGLQTEFAVAPYPVPKRGMGIRGYKFMTYPIRILHYAICLFLLSLSQEFLDCYSRTRPNISSRYGGDLRLENGKVVKHADAIYYKRHYKDFRSEVMKQATTDTTDKVAIRFDVDDYYDDLQVPRLLDLLDENVKASVRIAHFFDASAKDNIISFLRLANMGQTGIPQQDNDVATDFLGHLYLVFGDNIVEDAILAKIGDVREYKIVRYADDVFVFVRFKEATAQVDRQRIVSDLCARFADGYYHNLGLKLNSDSDTYWLSDRDELQRLSARLKKVSSSYSVPQAELQSDPQQLFAEILQELKKLQEVKLDKMMRLYGKVDEEKLKSIFDERVSQLVQSKSFNDQLVAAFQRFNLELVKASPHALIVLLSKTPNGWHRLRKHLLLKRHLTTADIDLILQLLAMRGFRDKPLFQKLKQDQAMSWIVRRFEDGAIHSERPGYFDLPFSKARRLAVWPEAIEQTQMRVLAELAGEYSIGLNHLLNEFHAICYRLDPSPASEYNALAVVNFLQSVHVPNRLCIQIRNLFDRRNINRVSHPSTSKAAALGVSEQEYAGYKDAVGKCLDHLL